MSKKPEWNDTTSYTQREARGKSEVRSWTLGKGVGGILVHRHICEKGVWFLSCYRLSVEQVRLDATDVDKAKEEALRRIAVVLKLTNDYYARLGVKI